MMCPPHTPEGRRIRIRDVEWCLGGKDTAEDMKELLTGKVAPV